MFDALPLDQYKANYAALLHGAPLPYGSMQGQVLLKAKYLRDFNDYDVLLRQNVPAKYGVYFAPPGSAERAESDAESDTDTSIEVSRSPAKRSYSLSPLKRKTGGGGGGVTFKDSEIFGKKDTEVHRNKSSSRPTLTPLRDPSEELEERSYSVLDSHLAGDPRLERLVKKLLGQLQRLRAENAALERQVQDVKTTTTDSDDNERLSSGIRYLLKLYKEKIEEGRRDKVQMQREAAKKDERIRELEVQVQRLESQIEQLKMQLRLTIEDQEEATERLREVTETEKRRRETRETVQPIRKESVRDAAQPIRKESVREDTISPPPPSKHVQIQSPHPEPSTVSEIDIQIRKLQKQREELTKREEEKKAEEAQKKTKTAESLPNQKTPAHVININISSSLSRSIAGQVLEGLGKGSASAQPAPPVAAFPVAVPPLPTEIPQTQEIHQEIPQIPQQIPSLHSPFELRPQSKSEPLRPTSEPHPHFHPISHSSQPPSKPPHRTLTPPVLSIPDSPLIHTSTPTPRERHVPRAAIPLGKDCPACDEMGQSGFRTHHRPLSDAYRPRPSRGQVW